MKNYDAALGLLTAYASRTSYVVSRTAGSPLPIATWIPEGHVSKTLGGRLILKALVAEIDLDQHAFGIGHKRNCFSRPPGTMRSRKVRPASFSRARMASKSSP